jgi:hypothetical protein
VLSQQKCKLNEKDQCQVFHLNGKNINLYGLLGRLAVVVLLCVFWMLLRTAPAEAAISSRFPDADSVSVVGGNFDAYAGVAQSGNYSDGSPLLQSIGRDTPTLLFKIFYQLNGPGASANATFNVSLLQACNVSEGVFTRGNPDMMVGVYRANPANGEQAAMVEQKANNVPASCNGNNMDFVIQRSDVTLVPSRYGSEWGVVIIRADKLPGVGANSFQVESTDGLGRVTFTEQLPADVSSAATPDPSTSFAIWDNPNWMFTREYSLEFTPDCAYSASYSDVYLRWYDADMDQIDPNVEFTIEIWTNGSPVPDFSQTINRNTTPDIGNTGPTSYRQLRVDVAGPNQYYRWTWRNVSGLNGLQFWMPFSEMNRYISCPAPPASISCEAQIMTANITPGSLYSVQFRINNNTASSVTLANQWQLGANEPVSSGSGTTNYMAPDAANWVRAPINWGAVGASIPAGGQGQWNTQFSARFPQLIGGEHTGPGGPYAGNLPPGNYSFQWRVIENDAVWLGTVCNATLTVINAPLVVGCNYNVSPVNPSAGQPVVITGVITNTDPGNTGVVSNADYDMIISASNGVRPPVSVDFDSDPGTPGNQDVPVGSQGIATVTGTAMGSVGTFVVSVRITQPSGPDITCGNTYNVAAKPYVKFYGADVNAGGSFNTTTAGSTNPCAILGGYNGTSIKTFAVNDRVIGSYHGSSVEFAAFSMAAIEGDASPAQNDSERGFFSASMRNGGWEGLYLTFANTPGAYAAPTSRWSATTWGGDFSTAPRCIEDYYETTRLTTVSNRNAQVINLDSNAPGNGILDTGQYQTTHPGRQVVLRAGAGFLMNNRVTLYVDGDLFIRTNITYNTDFTTGIPYLAIVAKGNIYIGAGVTNVDALLIAQPTDSGGAISGGRVYTCAKESGPNFEPYTSAELAAGACDQQLTIHGSITAQQIRFMRTRGSLNGAAAGERASASSAAEIIDMTPEFYAGVPLFAPRNGSNAGAQTYHAIQSLPPVF